MKKHYERTRTILNTSAPAHQTSVLRNFLYWCSGALVLWCSGMCSGVLVLWCSPEGDAI
jgi:hypothetical protein